MVKERKKGSREEKEKKEKKTGKAQTQTKEWG